MHLQEHGFASINLLVLQPRVNTLQIIALHCIFLKKNILLEKKGSR